MMHAALCAAMAMAAISVQAKDEGLRIMSFNIRIQTASDTGDYSWEGRKAACIKALKKHHPDVFGLQEALSYHKAYLMKELPSYQMVDRSSKPGTLDQELQNNCNPIFFRTDRFELLDYGSFWLNADQAPDEPGWDGEYARNVTWVKLECRKSGLIFFCFNTHFDHAGALARLQSSELVVSKIKEIAGDNAVVFLTGDFNMPVSDKAMVPLKSYLQHSNQAVKKPDPKATYNGFGQKGGKPLRLDHIFFRNATVRSFFVIDGRKYGVEYISDHYPVCSDFFVPVPKGK